MWYPGALDPSAAGSLDPSGWRPVSHSLATGSCFTRQVSQPGPYSQANNDVILFNMSNPHLAGGYSLMVNVHNAGMWLPSLGMSSEFAGQRMESIM